MASYQHIRLATKPTAELCYTFQPTVGTAAEPVLVVFLNGLGLPQDSWLPTVEAVRETRQGGSMPAILTYDRFGQGRTTDRDPSDEGAADPMHAHDSLSAVDDLRQLVVQIARDRMGVDSGHLLLVLVGNSLGCALARLYAQTQTQTTAVAGLLLLDSILAHVDMVDILPDPDGPGFDPDTLPSDTFAPDVGSSEGLSRRNLAALLPAADAPPVPLYGPGGREPWVTVVGHDFDTFAAESARTGSTPVGLTQAYTNPFWQRYNEGLARLTGQTHSRGPLQAPHAGHFVQRDNPAFVAAELDRLLDRLLDRAEN